MKLNKTIVLSATFLALIIGQFAIMNQKLLKTRKSWSKKLKSHRRYHKAATLTRYKSNPDAFFLPKELKYVPYLDHDIILKVKNVQLRNVIAPYNASLIEKDNDDHFLLFYRYDKVRQMHFNQYDTYIGCAELNENLDQTEKEVIKVNTQSPHSEDPRIIKNHKDFYLIFNDGPSQTLQHRKMHIAKLNSKTFQPISISKMDPHLAPVEKNWPPFMYQDTIHFEYQIFTPRKILRLENPSQSDLVSVSNFLSISYTDWEKKWGKPLGGTPARLIDGQYLAFFHSKFKDAMSITWYVMGAYTFEAHPPFQITAVSKQPLLFNGIYQTESINTSDPNKFVIFPCGYAVKQEGDRTVLHLACGENDCNVKIVTIDKAKLLNSLVSIDPLTKANDS